MLYSRNIIIVSKNRMISLNHNSSRLHIILIFLTLILSSHAIFQKCQTIPNPPPSNQTQCPQNSQCNNAGYCACDRGFFANCLVNGQYLNSSSHEFIISENFSYFIIEPTINEFVSFQFILCNQKSEANNELLNLWVDDGSLDTPTEGNALGSDKSLKVEEGCMALVTSFLTFSLQPNGQKQTLIFGIKLQNPGTTKIQLIVQQVQLFGFEIILRIILILIGGISLVSLGAIVYCIYKCRRRRSGPLNQQRNDISFFDDYMPVQKANLQSIKQEICSVCLGDFKENEEIRPTVCGHYFHKVCLDEWCVTNLSCPICRTSFEKAELIHQQYMQSRRTTASTNQRQLLQNHIMNGENNLREPIF